MKVIFILLALLIMNLDNPADQEFAQFLADLKRDAKNISVVDQPQYADWLEIADIIEITDDTNGIFAFTGDIDPRNVFTKGDKVRYKQPDGAFSTLYKYGYVIDVDADQFQILGGVNYFFEDENVESFAKGVGVNPVNFPTVLAYLADITGQGSLNIVYSPPNVESTFYMSNDIIYINIEAYSFTVDTSGGSSPVIEIALPADLVDIGTSFSAVGYGTDGDGTEVVIKATVTDTTIYCSKIGGANWTSGILGSLHLSINRSLSSTVIY